MVDQNRNSAIFYEQDGFKTDGQRLLGRQSAGESFLKGYVRFSGVDNFYCYTDHPQKFAAFSEQLTSWSVSEPQTRWINPMTVGKLQEPGCFFYSGPSLGSFAWQRRHVGSSRYSLCGLTHTISSLEVMEAFGDLAVAPFEEWDALICTSKSVKDTVDHVLAQWTEYLQERNGGKVKLPVQLPILPLGILCEDFEPTEEAEVWRNTFRAEHGIEKDDVVILYMGRFAAHAKAHPLPMYQALEKAAQKTDRKIHLVQAGWFATKAIEDQFKSGAIKFCPSVNTIFLDGRLKGVRQHVWHAADIFTSLSDNIQETFGITPVEAMAAGLPVVATDWDGYRETVRDGIDGILVRTTLPAPGCGADLAYRYQVGVDSYDRFVGQVGLFTNVDTEACTEAYLTLINNPELRHKMGAAGKKRARSVFDWRVLVPQYQDLWEGLAERRAAATHHSPPVPAAPLMDDPFNLFKHYPTQRMTLETRIQTKEGAQGAVRRYLGDSLGNGAAGIMPDAGKLELVLEHLERAGTCSIGELTKDLKTSATRMIRLIGWFAKMDLIRVLSD